MLSKIFCGILLPLNFLVLFLLIVDASGIFSVIEYPKNHLYAKLTSISFTSYLSERIPNKYPIKSILNKTTGSTPGRPFV